MGDTDIVQREPTQVNVKALCREERSERRHLPESSLPESE